MKPVYPIEFTASGYMTDNNQKACMKTINTARGFPDGFPLDEYPHRDDVEKVSPGIVDAHRNLSFGIDLKVEVLDIDANGNVIFGLHVPDNVRILKEGVLV